MERIENIALALLCVFFLTVKRFHTWNWIFFLHSLCVYLHSKWKIEKSFTYRLIYTFIYSIYQFIFTACSIEFVNVFFAFSEVNFFFSTQFLIWKIHDLNASGWWIVFGTCFERIIRGIFESIFSLEFKLVIICKINLVKS